MDNDNVYFLTQRILVFLKLIRLLHNKYHIVNIQMYFKYWKHAAYG